MTHITTGITSRLGNLKRSFFCCFFVLFFNISMRFKFPGREVIAYVATFLKNTDG